ncbi:MAG: sugar nucleotide-binding protein [Candidatus Nomurabacteria bacterium]|nr:sugar nucleotide-binding protein [Candidatus Nomurabacteria bacterium]
MKYLIFGNGYLGNKFKDFLDKEAEISSVDIGNMEEVRKVLKEKKPKIIINCAGKTGRPNIDWCEDHKEETMYSNVVGPLVLAEACSENNVFMVHIGSGCIYQGDNNRKGFTEEDIPDIKNIPSFYSLTKFTSEYMLKQFPVLQCRLRMPVDSQKSPRNFITKITNYEKVINEENSITVIDDLVKATIELVKRKRTGIYNVTNPGSITHKEILDKYKKLVDKNFQYTIINTKDLKTKAGRSNCVLNTDKLQKEGIKLPDIHKSIESILKNYN